MIAKKEYFNYKNEIDSYEVLTLDDLMDNNNTIFTNFAIAMRKLYKSNTAPFYVEIGSSHYSRGNHTYFLEKKLNWNGISVEIEKNFVDEFLLNRKNSCINEDALKINWDQHLTELNAPKRIDFLQIDIDRTPDTANFLSLINLPLSRYRFNAIAIEHGAKSDYTLEPIRSAQRYVLSALGYRLIGAGNNDDLWVDSEIYEPMQTNEITSMIKF